MEIKATNVYNQNLNDSSIGRQEIQNLYKENKAQNQKIVELYEKISEEKEQLIRQLRSKK